MRQHTEIWIVRVQRLAVVLVGALLASQSACTARHASSGEEDDREGVYVAGVEANTFRECRASLQWSVAFAPGAAPREWPQGAHGGFNATYYFVRWRVDLARPPRVPLGQASATLPRATVREVKELRALRPGECGEQF